MILFFDTSALIKLFHQEVGTEAVTSMVRDPSTGFGCWIWLGLNFSARCFDASEAG